MKNDYRNPCRCAIKDYLMRMLQETRASCNLTQLEFSEQLFIDPRSYSRIEHGERMCCLMTFAAYLAYHCKDPNRIASDFRHIFETYRTDTFLN